jgi:hypothetical protein
MKHCKASEPVPYRRSPLSVRARFDSAKGFAQQALEGRTGERRVDTELGQDGLHLTFAKAEVANAEKTRPNASMRCGAVV